MGIILIEETCCSYSSSCVFPRRIAVALCIGSLLEGGGRKRRRRGIELRVGVSGRHICWYLCKYVMRAWCWSTSGPGPRAVPRGGPLGCSVVVPVLGSFSAQVMYFAVASGQRCGSWIVLTATCMPTITITATSTSTSTSTVDIDGATQVPAASWYSLSGLPSLCIYCRRGQAAFEWPLWYRS